MKADVWLTFLTLKHRELPLAIFPNLGIRQWTLSLRDGFPSREPVKLHIDSGHVPLVIGQIIFRIDRVDRTFRYANRAIDAFVRINGQKIGPFYKAIHWANIHTVGVFALDAALCHNMGHGVLDTLLVLNKAF
jgi:hypothetical protein